MLLDSNIADAVKKAYSDPVDFQVEMADAIYRLTERDAEEKVREKRAALLDETYRKKKKRDYATKKKRYTKPTTEHAVRLTDSEASSLAEAVSLSNMSEEKLLHAYVIAGIKDSLAGKR